MATTPTTATSPDAQGSGAAAGSAGRVGRRPGPPSGRAVVGGLLVTLAALITLSAHAAAGRDHGVEVLAAARNLQPGERIGVDDVVPVRVRVPDSVRGLFGSVDAASGRWVTTHIGTGELLVASSTSVGDDAGDPHQLSLTVGRNRSVRGLNPGDRVDVFATWSAEVTELVVIGARVRAVRTADGTVVTRDGVTIDLGLDDPDQVEALVHAQATGDPTVVRSSPGQSLGPVGRRFRPVRSAAGTDG